MEAGNPYAPPRSDVTPVQAPDVEYEFRDLSRLTRGLVVPLVAGLVMECLGVVSSVMQLAMLSGPYTDEQADANDLRETLIGVTALGLYIATVIAFARWIYRAHRNLPALGAQGLRFTPGHACASGQRRDALRRDPCGHSRRSGVDSDLRSRLEARRTDLEGPAPDGCAQERGRHGPSCRRRMSRRGP